MTQKQRLITDTVASVAKRKSILHDEQGIFILKGLWEGFTTDEQLIIKQAIRNSFLDGYFACYNSKYH